MVAGIKSEYPAGLNRNSHGRQRRKAKAEGKYRGGIPTARAKADQVFALVDAGKTRKEVAEELGISIRC
jgi:DNA invertase Pin-like site-specific DNA recombinase